MSTAPDVVTGVELSSAVVPALEFQKYHSGPSIDGVWCRPMTKHRAENGWFAELLRAGGGLLQDVPPGRDAVDVQQVSVSYAAPGRINGYHIHPNRRQNEIWTVVQGQLTVCLVDCRAGSPTEGVLSKLVLSGEQPEQIFIPTGVAHGYRAGPEGALLIYFMDAQFDPADPNEGRLPWDHFGADVWEEDRG